MFLYIIPQSVLSFPTNSVTPITTVTLPLRPSIFVITTFSCNTLDSSFDYEFNCLR